MIYVRSHLSSPSYRLRLLQFLIYLICYHFCQYYQVIHQHQIELMSQSVLSKLLSFLEVRYRMVIQVIHLYFESYQEQLLLCWISMAWRNFSSEHSDETPISILSTFDTISLISQCFYFPIAF